MSTAICPRTSAAAPSRPKSYASGESAAEGTLSRILIVDDNRDFAHGLSQLLERRGHEVRWARRGVSALRLAHIYQPEFVLIDSTLPDLKGYEVAALLLGVIRSTRLRIASVSDYYDEEDRRLSQAAGCISHLRKPVQVAEIEMLFAGGKVAKSTVGGEVVCRSLRQRVSTPASSRLRLPRGNMPLPLGTSHFPTTRWTGVLRILGTDDLTLRKEALANLCRDYWYPLYAFARRLGRSPEDSEDLTQGFFAYALEHDVFSLADRNLGTLRTFLLRVFQRYIGDVRDREMAQKRGGGRELVSLNLEDGEERYSRDLATNDSPELLFDRTWAQAVLRATLSTLAASEQGAGRELQFAILQAFLTLDAVSEQSYEAAGRECGLTPEAARQAVCRLRKKFREFLREQIASTLHEPDHARIDEELRSLREALRAS